MTHKQNQQIQGASTGLGSLLVQLSFDILIKDLRLTQGNVNETFR